MYLVAIAWMYVVLMMTLAEGLSPQGTWLGAFFTLLLYGVAPLALVLYLLGTPMRRRAKRDLASDLASGGGAGPTRVQPDSCSHPAGLAVTSVGEAPVGVAHGAQVGIGDPRQAR